MMQKSATQKAARAEKWADAGAALALFAVNAYLVARLFRIEYLDAMWSVEGAYFGLARYIREHLFDLSWFPLWYGGIPFQYSYPPLLHFIDAGVSAAGRISPARAYHIVVALFFALGPAALFWTARRLGASRVAAFLAGIFYSLISPSCLIAGDLHRETGDWLTPRRLCLVVRYGDGPHIAALTLAVLAIGAFHVAIERRRPVYYVAAAIALASVVLTNWIGTFALALAIGCCLLSGFAGWKSLWLRAAGIACLAYALAMPWTMPATIRTIATNAPKLVGFSGSAGLAVAAAAIVLTLAWIIRRGDPSIRFAVLFVCATGVVSLGHFWAGIDLIPQPHRYHVAFDTAVCLLLALLLDRGLKLLIPRSRAALVLAVVALCVPIVIHQRRVARTMEQPIDIRATAEFKASRWLKANLPGVRVFAPIWFDAWIDAFSDTPLLTGGFANGIRNDVLWGATYQVNFGDNGEIALDWLKALGCDAIIAAEPGAPEFISLMHPEKLRGLQEWWRDGRVAIYAVPRRNRSLAHVLLPSDLPRETPVNYDTRPIQPYLAALDHAALPPAIFRWRGQSAASVIADLRPGQILSIQMTFDEGWKARVQGQPRAIYGDKLGQIVVEPRCNGACTVDLAYDGGWQMRVARIASVAAFAGSLLWIWAARRRANPAHLSPGGTH